MILLLSASWLICAAAAGGGGQPSVPAVASLTQQPPASALAAELSANEAWNGLIKLDSAIAVSLRSERPTFSGAKTLETGGKPRPDDYSRLLLLAAVTEGFPSIVGSAVPVNADRELLARALAGSALGEGGQRRTLTLVALARAFECTRALSAGGIGGESRDARLAETAWLAASVGCREYAMAAHDAIVSIGFKRTIAEPALLVLRGWHDSEEVLLANDLLRDDVPAACATYGAALAERWIVTSRLRERVRPESPQRERLDGLLAFRATVSAGKGTAEVLKQTEVSRASELYARSFASALAAWGAGRAGEEAAGQHLAALVPRVTDPAVRGSIYVSLSDWLAESKVPSAVVLMASLKADTAISPQARLSVARALVTTGRTDVESAGINLPELEKLLAVKVPRQDFEASEWHNAQLGVLAAATKQEEIRIEAAKVLRGYSWGAHQNRVVAVGSLAARGEIAFAESMFDTQREGLQGTHLCLIALAAGAFRQEDAGGASVAMGRLGNFRNLSEISRHAGVGEASAMTLRAGLWSTQISYAERHAPGTTCVSDAWIRSGLMWSGTVPFPFSATR